jgi:hypothetical protein
MKSFTEFHDEQKQLDEGLIRSGSVATFAARSATAGKKAERAYKNGLSVLDDSSQRDDHIARLDRIDAALKALLDGHVHQRQQISNHVALDTVGHLSGGKNKPRR